MTLFERVTYGGDAQGVKISIHMIQSLMSELASSRLSVSDVVSVIDLDQGQSNDFSVVLSKAMQASNPQDFASKVFAFLMLSTNSKRDPSGILDYYTAESNFWSMIDTEAVK